MKLITYLKRNKMSRRAFAKSIGLSPQAITYYIKGQRTPSLPVAMDIVKATRGAVSLRDLIDGTREQEEKERAVA